MPRLDAASYEYEPDSAVPRRGSMNWVLTMTAGPASPRHPAELCEYRPGSRFEGSGNFKTWERKMTYFCAAKYNRQSN